MQTETFDRIKIEQYHNRLMSHRLIIAHLLYNWGIPTVWQFYCITDVIRADTILLLLNCSSKLICRSIHISTFYKSIFFSIIFYPRLVATPILGLFLKRKRARETLKWPKIIQRLKSKNRIAQGNRNLDIKIISIWQKN